MASRGRCVAFLPLVLLAVSRGAPATAAPEGPDVVPLAVESRLGLTFPAVVAEAAALLSVEPCRLLLRDFADRRTGLPLETTLAATGLTPEQYVRSIHFRSGDELSRCGAPGMLAFTSPGSRAVVVCPYRIFYFRTSGGTPTVVLVIHEALHSLGLGENPPSSQEITAKVESRCGR